jgi:Fur family peroxide stress response transcriptional regulator
MVSVVHTPDELTLAFRHRGLKVTPQRQCIFRILHANEFHPTAEAVYAEAVAEMPTISLRTVYQTLNDLADMGEIRSLDLGTGSARFDSNTDGHHHLVCDRCGRVRDVYVDDQSVRLPPRKTQGYRVTSTEIVFRGLCDQCSTKPNPVSEKEGRHG